MSIVVEGWERGECPIVDGIYFPDDCYFPLELLVADDHPSAVSATTGMGKLIVEPPLAEDTRFQVYGGETSWEGCGYLALVSKPHQSLAWLIHSSDKRAFSRSSNRKRHHHCNFRRIPIFISVVRADCGAIQTGSSKSRVGLDGRTLNHRPQCLDQSRTPALPEPAYKDCGTQTWLGFHSA